MFCDLVGSAALSARFDPEHLRAVIGAYHRSIARFSAVSHAKNRAFPTGISTGADGNVYVDSSRSAGRRVQHHLYGAGDRQHRNRYLQRAFDKHRPFGILRDRPAR
jgi:hypothetical protein